MNLRKAMQQFLTFYGTHYKDKKGNVRKRKLRVKLPRGEWGESAQDEFLRKMKKGKRADIRSSSKGKDFYDSSKRVNLRDSSKKVNLRG